MRELNHLEKLDAVLFEMKKDYLRLNPLDTIGLLIINANDNLIDGITKPEYDAIIRKLAKDGYFEIDQTSLPDLPIIKLTYDALLFEGYVKQKQIEDVKLQIILKNESRKSKNDCRLIAGTWFAGIAALLLLGWYVFQWYYPSYDYFVSKNSKQKISVLKKH